MCLFSKNKPCYCIFLKNINIYSPRFIQLILYCGCKKLIYTSNVIYWGQPGYICKVSKWVIDLGKTWDTCKRIQQNEGKTTCYLTGVLGLPGNFRGERTFGSKENFSLTFLSTDGATYVKPWGRSGWQRDLSPLLQRPSLKTTHSWWWAMKHWVNPIMQCGGVVSGASRKSSRTKPDGMY